MSEFQERHAEVITLVRLSRLRLELESKAKQVMSEALHNASPELVTESLRAIAEWELVHNELMALVREER
jgi:hypothetical protein